MWKLCVLLLLPMFLVVPAQAGLLEDDEARQQIQQLEARVLTLEDALKQQSQSLKQQSQSMLDLQSQIDALNTEIRNLRGQSEETTHGLQDAEKREKDFYVDLDTRLRHFESAEAAAKEAVAKAAAASVPIDSFDPVTEDRAIEAAYRTLKSGDIAGAIRAFQDFMARFPGSVHIPNATYWLGDAQFAAKDYKSALGTFQDFLKNYPESAKSADAMLEVSNCFAALNKGVAARKTLKLLVAKYPGSEAAEKAKRLLASTN